MSKSWKPSLVDGRGCDSACEERGGVTILVRVRSETLECAASRYPPGDRRSRK